MRRRWFFLLVVLGSAAYMGLMIFIETAWHTYQSQVTTSAFVEQNRALGDFIQEKLPESGGFTYQTPLGQLCTTWTRDSRDTFIEYRHRLQELQQLTEELIWYERWKSDTSLAELSYLTELNDEILQQIIGIKIMLQVDYPVGSQFCISLPTHGAFA